MLEELRIQGVRNLEASRLQLSGGFNVFAGANGAGKTSVLEACHLLSVGRSFRTQQLRRVVREGEHYLGVGGTVRDPVSGTRHRLGVEWQGSRRSRLDGEWLRGHARVAEWLPSRVLHAGSFDLVREGPEERRRLLDWGCFHGIAGYREAWQRWRRAHEQRNAALRQGQGRAAREFEGPLVAAGERVTRAREDYVGEWRARTLEAAGKLGFEGDLEGLDLRLRPGWEQRRSLAEAVDRSRSTDAERGFAQVGPQRADLVLKLAGRDATEGSRGEQKRLVTALVVGQGLMLEARTGRSPLLLLDDVLSELDRGVTAGLLGGLDMLGWQVLLTAVDHGAVGDRVREPRMFHVEHGRVAAPPD
ncbi:DNA replication/repair protein RecF [Thioalkalivibrio sp. ALE23]|uniref:DNA replication/repair protein RecF n=1 Tax=Thioalkalivibrio sp. ALE23 TaxID=1265495 RepID=UPI0003799719|nr:DNA replication and repair protein RecF [Thioalkalivibrio sp. ALE23]